MSDIDQQPRPANAVPEQAAAKVHWDQSQMRTEYANVLNILSTREEFSLLFGMNSMWSLSETKNFEVKLSNRIILTPFAAKRLCALLNERVVDYEAKHGSLDIGL